MKNSFNHEGAKARRESLKEWRCVMVRRMTVGVILMVAGLGWAQTTAPATQAAIDPKALEVLKLLQEREKTLKDFLADVLYEVESPTTGEVTSNDGVFAYKNDGARMQFSLRRTNLKIDGKVIKSGIKEDIIFDGEWLLIVDHGKKDLKKIQVSPPPAPGSKPKNPARLAGPLPMPIGQDAAEVQAKYDVKLIKPGVDDPKTGNEVRHLKLTPKSRAKSEPREMELWVDMKDELPVKIVVVQPDEAVTRITLKNAKVNEGKAETVAPPQTDNTWSVEVRPL